MREAGSFSPGTIAKMPRSMPRSSTAPRLPSPVLRRRGGGGAGRGEGAGHAAETGREHDCGGGRADLEDTHCCAAAARQHDNDGGPLKRRRPKLPRQCVHVAFETGARCATPDVRAQRRLFDL